MKHIKRLVKSLYKKMWPEEFKKVRLARLSDYVPKSYVEQWQKYYADHDVNLKRTRLLLNIDSSGQAVADAFLRYQTFFVSSLKEADNCYFAPEDFLTAQQKAECEKIDFHKYKKHFALEFCDVSALCYHSGLKNILFVREYIKGKDFIDGGAYTGDSALGFEEYEPSRIYSFEPLPLNQRYLQDTIKRHNLKRVLPVQLGLGDKKESLYMEYDPKILNAATLVAGGGKDKSEKIKIDIISLDDFAAENHLNVGLIKLDVEGFEMKVIRGAQKTIKGKRPVLLISIYHSPEDFFEIKPLIEAWDLHYKFEILKTDPFSPYPDVMLAGYPEELKRK
jgi:FkbM family methyltransferase